MTQLWIRPTIPVPFSQSQDPGLRKCKSRIPGSRRDYRLA